MVTPIAYFLHTAFTFRTSRSGGGLLRFTAGVISAVPVWLASMALLCDGLDVPVVVAAPLTTLVVLLWNYMLARWSIAGVIQTVSANARQ